MNTLTLDLDWMLKNTELAEDNQRMVQCKQTPGGIVNFNIEHGEDDRGVIFRKSSGQFEENNKIRQQLIDSLKVQFGVKTHLELPLNVLEALNICVWKDDMKIDSNGHVTSGRPLTARRIRKVISAVKEDLALNKSLEMAKKDAEEYKEVDGNNIFNRLHDGIAFYHGWYNFFTDGIDSEIFYQFGNKISTMHNNFIPSNLIEKINTGSVWKRVTTDLIIGYMEEESRDALKYFVNSKECLDFMRDLMNNTVEKEVAEYLYLLRVSIAKFYGFDIPTFNRENK